MYIYIHMYMIYICIYNIYYIYVYVYIIYIYIYIYIYKIIDKTIVIITFESGRLSLQTQAMIGTGIYACRIYSPAMKHSDKTRKKKTKC